MSISFSGTLTRSAGIVSAISKQLRNVTLKPVKRITIKFDPFHENALSIRDFMFHMSTEKIAKTNLNCSFKPEILCNRQAPSITFNLQNGEKVVFKTENLTFLELLQLYNKYITPLAPKEEEISSKLLTKGVKKIVGRRK